MQPALGNGFVCAGDANAIIQSYKLILELIQKNGTLLMYMKRKSFQIGAEFVQSQSFPHQTPLRGRCCPQCFGSPARAHVPRALPLAKSQCHAKKMGNFATGHYSMSIFADERYFNWSLLLDTIQIVTFATRHYVYYNNNQ